MQVIKSSGDFEKFDGKKIYHSIRDAGGSNKLARGAVKEIKKKFRAQTSTEEILNFLIKFLSREPGVSERYDLKRAIMSLGPSGFPFEKFFAQVLESSGYKTTIDNKLKGKKIFQEVDIVAEKEKKWMIECKYHNESGTMTRLHVPLYTYARFLDLKNYNFYAPWLVTNTKCSRDAVEYAGGVGLRITSWKYPKKDNLQSLIEMKKLYPITILKKISNDELNKIYESEIVIAKDLLNFSEDELSKKTQISTKRIAKILEEVREVCG